MSDGCMASGSIGRSRARAFQNPDSVVSFRATYEGTEDVSGRDRARSRRPLDRRGDGAVRRDGDQEAIRVVI